jgi:hypothetical protein
MPLLNLSLFRATVWLICGSSTSISFSGPSCLGDDDLGHSEPRKQLSAGLKVTLSSLSVSIELAKDFV